MGKGRRNHKANPQQGDWGWFAGLVDGDGCISIQEAHGRYRASVIVVNKKPENILKLLRLFGGSLGDVSRSSAHSYINGIYYRWVVSASDEVLWLLKNSINHMAEKKEKAKLAIELCELRKKRQNMHLRKCPDDIKAKMELIYSLSVAETECPPRIKPDATVRTHGMANHESRIEISDRP